MNKKNPYRILNVHYFFAKLFTTFQRVNECDVVVRLRSRGREYTTSADVRCEKSPEAEMQQNTLLRSSCVDFREPSDAVNATI